MIPETVNKFIENAIAEDIGDGDHSSLSCISAEAAGKAKLIIKEKGILAGIDITRHVFEKVDPSVIMDVRLPDGTKIKPGDTGFFVEGPQQSLLKAERLVLNILQRMSGIATRTRDYVEALKEYNTKILDTRKTTPCFRYFEKEAVRIGGGMNHRMGLFDMIMLKDNHIDLAGGIPEAIGMAREYISKTKKDLRIEIESRNLDDVRQILNTGGVDRIMLDNFTVEDTRAAVLLIDTKYETESSGGITFETIKEYAACGVDYISVGALTHQINSLDMSLKVV
jgi:nicotinate-nucleotide pyrophosphorylase (carboxylating)